MKLPKYMSMPEVAVLDGISPAAAYRRLYVGAYGPAAAMVDGHPRIRVAEWQALRGVKLNPGTLDRARDEAKKRTYLRDQASRAAFARKKALTLASLAA